jgi:hypothetical protein
MLAMKIVCRCSWLDHSLTGAQFIFASNLAVWGDQDMFSIVFPLVIYCW